MGMELCCRSIAGFILSELQANERQRRNVRNEIGQVAPHRHLGRKSQKLAELVYNTPKPGPYNGPTSRFVAGEHWGYSNTLLFADIASL